MSSLEQTNDEDTPLFEIFILILNLGILAFYVPIFNTWDGSI